MKRTLAMADNCIDVYYKLDRYYLTGNSIDFALNYKDLGGDVTEMTILGNDVFADALEEINTACGNMPLVLHGGTGIPEDMIKKAISLGVSKINVNTECQLAFQEATRAYIEAGKDLEGKGFDPRKLLNPGFEAIKATVKEKMELFGSINKA